MKKNIIILTLIFFTLNVLCPPTLVAQTPLTASVQLPNPGTMITLSPPCAPVNLEGLFIDPQDPFKFKFLIDPGDSEFDSEKVEQESAKLIRYFLTALTIPEEEMWVNLSPYEQNRIIPETLSQTEMGRDLMTQDYMLKQLSSSLMYPFDDIGEQYWSKVYDSVGPTDAPTTAVDTINKIWITPQHAEIYEYDQGMVITESRLKVMLEDDYLALAINQNRTDHGLGNLTETELDKISHDASLNAMRSVLVPAVEQEVNEGEIFVNLRQIYRAIIMAAWYKEKLKQSILSQAYNDQKKISGIELEDKDLKTKIYDQYVEALDIGVFHTIKEDYDPATDEMIPREYFSGGEDLTNTTDTTDKKRGTRGRQKPIRDFLKRGTLIATVVLTGLFARVGISANAAARPLDEGTRQSRTVNQEYSAKEVRDMVVQHMEYCLKYKKGFPNNNDVDFWKKHMRQFVTSARYPNNAMELWQNEDLLGMFIHYYFQGFKIGMEKTGSPYFNSEKNLNAMMEALKDDANFAETTVLDVQLSQFFKNEWTNFILAVANGRSGDISSALYKAQIKVEKLLPELSDMMGEMYRTLNSIDDQDRVDRILIQWRDFNMQYLVPRNFYGTLAVGTKKDEDSGTSRKYFLPVIYRIERRKEGTIQGGQKIPVIYGQKIDSLKLAGPIGGSVLGEPIVFVNTMRQNEQVTELRDVINGGHFYLNAAKTVSSGYIDAWIRKQYGGLSDNELDNTLDHDLRVHELTHKSFEQLGLPIPKGETFGVEEGFWNRLPDKDRQLIADEIAAYSSEMRNSAQPGYVVLHLLPHLLGGQGTAEYFAARYVINSEYAAMLNKKGIEWKQEDWVDWRDANKTAAVAILLLNQSTGDLSALSGELLKDFPPELKMVQPFRFPKYIWDEFKKQLGELPLEGIVDFIRDHGIAWTDHMGRIHYFYENIEFKAKYGDEAVPLVWNAAREAVNVANKWDRSDLFKYLTDAEDVINVVAEHEEYHRRLRQNTDQRLIQTFQDQIRTVFRRNLDPLNADHPFIQSFLAVYGEPDELIEETDEALVNWVLEEFLVLSLQEYNILNNDIGSVLERVAEQDARIQIRYYRLHVPQILEKFNTFLQYHFLFDPTPENLSLEEEDLWHTYADEGEEALVAEGVVADRADAGEAGYDGDGSEALQPRSDLSAPEETSGADADFGAGETDGTETDSADDLGGIDLNADGIDMRIRRGQGGPGGMRTADIPINAAQINALQGFYPTIINMTPFGDM